MDTNPDMHKHLTDCASLTEVLELSTQLLSVQTSPELIQSTLNQAKVHCHNLMDYIQLADFASSHNEQDFADSLYDKAIQIDTNPAELIKAADRMILANNAEKAELFLKQAAIQSFNAADLYLCAITAKKSLGNNALTKELLITNEHKIKDLDGYLNLCRSLIREGDKKLAKELLLSAKRLCHDSIGKTHYAFAVDDLFKDTRWTIKILAEAEADCDCTKDFIVVSKGYRALLNDSTKVSILMEQAVHLCESDQDHIELGNGFCELLNDKDSALANYQKAIPGITEKDALLLLAQKVIHLGDKDLAKTIYAKSELQMSSSSELCKLAQSIVHDLDDIEYALEIYKRADKNTFAVNELINLANEVVFHTNEKTFARNIYERAYESSTTPKQLLTLLEYVEINIEDKEFAGKILKKAEKTAEDTEDLLEVSTQILSVLDYKDFAREVTQCAEERVANVNDMNSLVKHVSERFSDDTAWTNQLNDKLARFKSSKAK